MKDLDRDERLMSLVELALSIPAADRLQYLREACSEDQSLLDEVLERVQWEEKMKGFLQEPLVPRQDLDRPFLPGQVLSDRFEIIREIAEGGMATVYEAYDRTLEQKIAIKCPKVGFRRRLPPEIRMALQVSHPNVCRVYEFHTAAMPSGDVDFLTMEYLEGETLLDRQARQRLTPDEALVIAKQVCAGLEEAHRQGVVHGDLKGNNVILAQGSDGRTRAVITDFGLARQARSSGAAPAMASRLRGTPDFIAPELWKGEAPSKASDIYALGVLLYEMISGERPFAKTSKGSTAPAGPSPNEETGAVSSSPGSATRTSAPVNRFGHEPTPPSKTRKGLPGEWDKAVLQCLAQDPAKRPASPAVVARMLERDLPQNWLMGLLVLIVLTVGGYFVYQTLPASDDIRLVVMSFDADPDANALGNGVLEDLSARLTRLQRGNRNLLIIPLAEVLRYRVQGLDTVMTVLGATHALQGRFQRSGDKLRVEAVVMDAQTRQKVRDFASEYTRAEMGNLPAALVGTVTAALKLNGMLQAQTLSQGAYEDYALGLSQLRSGSGEADRAIEFFERASRTDPNSPLPYAGLAEAQMVKYRDTRLPVWRDQAIESLRKAESRNPDVSEVRLISGLMKADSGLYSEALEDLNRAVQLDPKNPDARRRLGNVYAAMNLPAEAVRTFQQGIAAHPGYYRTYLDLGVFYGRRGNAEESARQYTAVTRIAPALFQGHHDLGAALVDAGQFEEAEKELKEALRLRENGLTLMALGALMTYQKRYPESVAYYEKARAAGPETVLLYGNLGDACRRAGRTAEAQAAYREGLARAEKEMIGNPRAAPARAMAGYLEARLGDSRRAELDIAQALALAPQDIEIVRRAVMTYETLGSRQESLRVLQTAPGALLRMLSRQPDLADLSNDSRFVQLKQSAR